MDYGGSVATLAARPDINEIFLSRVETCPADDGRRVGLSEGLERVAAASSPLGSDRQHGDSFSDNDPHDRDEGKEN